MKLHYLPVVDGDTDTLTMLAAMRGAQADAVLVKDNDGERVLTADQVMAAHNGDGTPKAAPVRTRARDIASEHHVLPSRVLQLETNTLASALDNLASALGNFSGVSLVTLDVNGDGIARVLSGHETTLPVVTWSGQCWCAGPDPDVHYFKAAETKSFPNPAKCKYFHRATLTCA
jgi:hypothetical protein